VEPSSQRTAFRALAECVVPEAAGLGEQDWSELEALVQQALSTRSPAVRTQIVLFLRVLNWLPLFRHGRSLAHLPLAARTCFLARLQRSRFLLVRRGVWGLRTLVFLGYYGRPAAATEIGYRASPGGWEARS